MWRKELLCFVLVALISHVSVISAEDSQLFSPHDHSINQQVSAVIYFDLKNKF